MVVVFAVSTGCGVGPVRQEGHSTREFDATITPSSVVQLLAARNCSHHSCRHHCCQGHWVKSRINNVVPVQDQGLQTLAPGQNPTRSVYTPTRVDTVHTRLHPAARHRLPCTLLATGCSIRLQLRTDQPQQTHTHTCTIISSVKTDFVCPIILQRPSEGGAWKHDMYSKSTPDSNSSTRSSTTNKPQGKSAKLQISNLHYEVSESELEVSIQAHVPTGSHPWPAFTHSSTPTLYSCSSNRQDLSSVVQRSKYA